MRWEELFADLEAQLAAADQQALEAEVADQARAEYAQALVADRLRARIGHPVRARLAGGILVTGRVGTLGAGWAVLEDGTVEHLVPLGAAVCWEGLGRGWNPADGAASGRLGLGHALRALSRARARVRVQLAGGGPLGVLEGTVDGVGGDFFDVALHPDDDYRRRVSVTAVRTVPFDAALCVSSLAGP